MAALSIDVDISLARGEGAIDFPPAFETAVHV
jgi:hypothetical protein